MQNCKPTISAKTAIKPSTKRMRALKERKKKGIKLPHCTVCGAKCTARQSIALELCSGCRRLTTDGRKKARQQVKEIYQRSKYLKQYLARLGANPDSKLWEWHRVEDRLPNSPDEVVAETIRGAILVARYNTDLAEWFSGSDGTNIQVAKWCVV